MEAVHTSFTLIFLPLLEQILYIFAHLPPIQQPLYEHLVASVEGELLALKTERQRVELICAHSLQVYQTPAVSHMEQINFLENPNGPLDLLRAMAAGAGLRAQVWVRFLQSKNL